MRVVYPSYYDSFACSASACPDTCCQGWGIAIDRETYGKYMSLGGLMGAKLRKNIDHRRRRFRLNSRGRCVFLDSHGLCGLCVDLGEGMMCRTCRIYPRHQESYGDLAEVSLSLSCPEAARLVLDWQEETVYRQRERSSEKSMGEERESGDVDKPLLNALLRARRAMFDLLRRGDLGEELRAGAVLALAHDAGKRLDRRDFSGAEAVCARYGAAPPGLMAEKLSPFREMGFQRRKLDEEYLDELEKLEEVSGGWRELLREARKSTSEKSPRRELNLLEYFLYLLYPGAVYDGDSWSKAKLGVFGLLAVRRLAGGADGDFLRAAWMYSRQVEHSDANLERLETYVRESRSCALPQMLACLLGE